jgi:hypothetical protein
MNEVCISIWFVRSAELPTRGILTEDFGKSPSAG